MGFLVILLLALSPTAGMGLDDVEHPEKAVCTVCAARSTHGSDPDPERVRGISEHRGQHYYFCSEECKAEFDESPDWWVPMQLPHPVPELQLRDLDGNVVDLEIGDGKHTVLDFWATWCQPCKKTMRQLQARFEQNEEDLRIVGISIDEGEGALDKVRQFAQKQGATYPLFLDDQPAPAWVALKVHAVPTILLVDHQGRVVWRYTGPDGDEKLDRALDE